MSGQPLRRADAANEASAHARVADHWRIAWPRFDRDRPGDGAGVGVGTIVAVEEGEDLGRWTQCAQTWKPTTSG